ncbi:putative polyketide synthase [Sclerotinia borealis F-4128]|uniref:Putative polyketide synthase n=1 Tax=Sclerotinia borealis (strain F-4128) TaxID=1432307 RepID=W9CH03_SCLBF|nr:putative polyketide synthase [Sclerotinia borealis F-4128]
MIKDPENVPKHTALAPGNVAISGEVDQIDALKKVLDLKIPYLLEKNCNLSPGDVPESATMVSLVTGRTVSTEDLCKSESWAQNMECPARFSEALTQIVQNSELGKSESDGESVLIGDLLELGPHSTLQWPIEDTLKSIIDGDKVSYTSVLVRFAPALQSTLQALSRLHCLGCSVRIANINEHEGKLYKSLHNLPEYLVDLVVQKRYLCLEQR